jgi:hypothetical protein
MPHRVKGLCQTRLKGCAYQARGAVPRDTFLRGGSESHTSCVGWEGFAVFHCGLHRLDPVRVVLW